MKNEKQTIDAIANTLTNLRDNLTNSLQQIQEILDETPSTSEPIEEQLERERNTIALLCEEAYDQFYEIPFTALDIINFKSLNDAEQTFDILSPYLDNKETPNRHIAIDNLILSHSEGTFGDYKLHKMGAERTTNIYQIRKRESENDVVGLFCYEIYKRLNTQPFTIQDLYAIEAYEHILQILSPYIEGRTKPERILSTNNLLKAHQWTVIHVPRSIDTFQLFTEEESPDNEKVFFLKRREAN